MNSRAKAYIDHETEAVRSTCCKAPVFGELTVYYNYVYISSDGYSLDDAVVVSDSFGPFYCDNCKNEVELDFDWGEEADDEQATV